MNKIPGLGLAIPKQRQKRLKRLQKHAVLILNRHISLVCCMTSDVLKAFAACTTSLLVMN